MRKKYTLAILSVVLIIIVFGVWSVERKFDEPFKAVEGLVQDAKLNSKTSSYLLEEQSWIGVKEKSLFRLSRKELNWDEFKNRIQVKDVSSITIGTKNSLFYKLGNIKNNSRQVEVYTYDSTGTERDFIPLLLEKVDGNWLVAGIGN